MGTLRTVAVAVLSLSLFVFIVLFGRVPALRNTPIGFLYRVLCVNLPRVVTAIDKALTGGLVVDTGSRFGHYLWNEKHPLILVFFLGLITSAATLFLSSAWQQLGTFHHFVIPIVLPLPYIFTYICNASTASYVFPQNHDRNMQRYPFDHVLYFPGHTCRTCSFEKPARSKHCSLCRTCVARADHHCVWTNNCIGGHNYKWFLLLLLSITVLLAYATALAYNLLTSLRPPQSSGTGILAYFDRWGVAITRDVRVGAVGLLCLLTAPLPFGMLVYHIYLIWLGATVNETKKWSDLREDMANGLILKGQRNHETTMGSEEYETREKVSSWPVRSSQCIKRLPENKSQPETAAGVVDGRNFQKVWHLGDVDNLYDIGFRDNFIDCIFY